MGRGSVIAEGVDGHYYVVKDVAPSVLGMPFVWLAHIFDVSPVRSILLLSPIVTALTAALLFCLIRTWDYSRKTSVFGALVYGLATLAWPYAETIHTQPLAALGLLLAIYGTAQTHQTNKWVTAFMGGIGLGLAGASTVATWITAPAYLLYLVPWETIRQPGWRAHVNHRILLLVTFGIGASLILLSLGLYNLLRFGSPLQTAYHQSQAVSWLNPLYLPGGVFIQLFSTPRGLVWYTPLAILVPYGIAIGYRERRMRQMLLPLAQISMLFPLYSIYAMGVGGLAWGPRFLIVIIPALILLTIPLLDRLMHPCHARTKFVISCILAISFVTQLLASLFDNLAEEGKIFQYLIEITASSPTLSIDRFLIDPQWLPLVRLIKVTQNGEWDVLWMATGQLDGLLLGADLTIILLAIVWVILSTCQKGSRVIIGGLTIQIGLSAGVALLMLLRYPVAPGEYSPRQTFYPENLDELAATLTAVVEPGDGVAVLLPYSYLRWVDSYDEPAPDFGMPLESPVSPATAELLELASQSHSRLWLVTEIPNNHPQNGTESWLSEHGFVGNTIWVGGYRIVAFTFEQHPLTLRDSRHVFGSDELALIGYAAEPGRGPWLNVWLRWEALREVEDYYIVTVQLLNESGVLVAQHDSAPGNSYAPTSMWSTGQIVDDRHSVALPADLPPGTYRLAVALYRISDGERLPLADGSGDLALVGLIELPASD